MALYRTHRPQKFADLLGQEAVSTTLQHALALQRISHAYLFTGPRGTGKTSSARIFARALSCSAPLHKEKKGGHSYEPCNSCENCQAILSGRTPDIVEIDAASNRGIEDIRLLREQVQYAPLQLPRKVYIIDEVHMLTGEAFNALLKTLEEPPAHTLFILATTELHKVPVTIRSRCQLLLFRPGSPEKISEKLDRIVTHEKLQVEPGVTLLIARHAEGGFRDAETLLESLSVQHSPLTLEQARLSLGIVAEEHLNTLLTPLLAQNVRTTVDVLNSHFHSPLVRVEGVLEQLIERVRSLLAEEAYPAPLLTYMLEQFLEAYILQKSAPDPTLALDIACLNVCAFGKPMVSIDQQGIFSSEEKSLDTPAVASSAPPVTVEPLPAPSAASVPVVEVELETSRLTKDLRKAWKTVSDRLCTENIALGQALKETVFHRAENGHITIHVRFKFHADKMGEKKNKARIQELMKELTGQQWEIDFVIVSTMPKRQPSKSLEEGLKDAVAVFGENESK